MIRIGLYGGSFDPVHFGHLISARAVAEQLSLSKVVLIPCARPPHPKNHDLTEIRERVRMLELAAHGDSLFEVDDLESRREGPSYTFDTVNAYRTTFGNTAELFWIIGGDSLPELPTWYRVSELVTRVQIVTAVRPGWTPPRRDLLVDAVGDPAAAALLSHCLKTPHIEISATDIRARVASGRSIHNLTPPAVEAHILQKGLYRGDS